MAPVKAVERISHDIDLALRQVRTHRQTQHLVREALCDRQRRVANFLIRRLKMWRYRIVDHRFDTPIPQVLREQITVRAANHELMPHRLGQ